MVVLPYHDCVIKNTTRLMSPAAAQRHKLSKFTKVDLNVKTAIILIVVVDVFEHAARSLR